MKGVVAFLMRRKGFSKELAPDVIAVVSQTDEGRDRL